MADFDQDTQIERISESTFRAFVSDRWNVGPVPNGGYLLALAIKAMGSVAQRTVRTVNVHYLRPAKNAPVTIEVEPIKIGRKFATLGAKMTQEGGEHARVLATFSTDDVKNELRIVPSPLKLPPLEECVNIKPPEAITVGHRFDVHYTQDTAGFLVGKPNGRPKLEAWVRFADGRDADVESLPLIADALPPPVLNAMAFQWVPTLELTVHVRKKPAPGWLRVKFETRFVFDGYLEADGEIWDSEDGLCAQSRQLMMVP